MNAQKTILILCAGNSCRSQMAEALINHDLGLPIRAFSAGTHPGLKVASDPSDGVRQKPGESVNGYIRRYSKGV